MTYEILEHPDGVDGGIVDWRHLHSRCISPNWNQGEIEWTKPLANLLESRAYWERGIELVVLFIRGAVACGVSR